MTMGLPDDDSSNKENDASSSSSSSSRSIPVLLVTDNVFEVSPASTQDCWLGAEVHVVTNNSKIARRCSYEEMVHEEQETSEAKPSGQVWHRCVLRITQWALTLQEVFEERGGQRSLNNKCLCHKAKFIGQKLSNLAAKMASEDSDNLDEEEDDLVQIVDEVQSTLRAGVSIQVSFLKARWRKSCECSGKQFHVVFVADLKTEGNCD
jgi:hypothetical protein